MLRLGLELMTRLAAIAAVALFLATSAVAQPVVCQPHHKVKKELLDKYNEVLVAHGLAGPGALFELYASSSGTWTVILTRSSMANLSCIQGAGTDFSLTGNKYPPPKSDPA
jgi:hypothetical protein